MGRALSGMRRLRRSFGLLEVGILAAGISAVGSCARHERNADAPEHLRIGCPREPLNALVTIAVDRGFFQDEGLRVTVADDYSSGKRALESMLRKEVEITAAAQTPIVFESFQRDDFAVLATIGSSDNEPRILARKDRGIQRPGDLRGKRVGTQRGSAVHFFLHVFLLRHGLAEKDAQLSFRTPEELPQALARGEIDAFCMREPFVSEAAKLLGKSTVVFAEPGLYLKTFNLVAMKGQLDARRGAFERLLRALIRAESFAHEHPAQAIQIVAGKLGLKEPDLRALWQELELRVSLGPGLLQGLEDEARWAVASGLTRQRETPNYLRFLAPDALEAVRPSAVTVVH